MTTIPANTVTIDTSHISPAQISELEKVVDYANAVTTQLEMKKALIANLEEKLRFKNLEIERLMQELRQLLQANSELRANNDELQRITRFP